MEKKIVKTSSKQFSEKTSIVAKNSLKEKKEKEKTEKTEKTDNVEKIDLNILIRDFQIEDELVFGEYLENVWKDLSSRSSNNKGIDKLTFSQYYDLPGIINDRLFNLLDSNKDELIDMREFIQGMEILFTQGFNELSEFIFCFYDFDNDHQISKEDVRVVLSYVPLQKKYSKDKMRFEQDEFVDRLESQSELNEMLNTAFGNKKKINLKDFKKIIDNVSSDIFIYILMFLLEKKPFSNDTIRLYSMKDYKKDDKKNNSPAHYVASPSLKTKLASPSLKKRASRVGAGLKTSNILNLFSTNQGKIVEVDINGKEKGSDKKISLINELKKEYSTEKEKDSTKKLAPKKRIKKSNFAKLEDNLPSKSVISVPIKQEQVPASSTTTAEQYEDFDENDQPPVITNNGTLYKFTHSNKFKPLYFKLIGKDIFYYKSKEDLCHLGMHNLCGVYIKEAPPVEVDNKKYYAFSISYPQKDRTYYCENEAEFKIWMEKLKCAVENKVISDQYNIGNICGKGKFGLVRLGTHKASGRPVAIKVMAKKEMNMSDLELARTEIDILKVCQHPNIIKLYDVFENENQIFIVMEYCAGGDLFTFIEERGFKLPEAKAADIIHKLSMAVYYLHSYGIVHRDLKPENILMTSNDDDADIRLLDFGLSKIVGPNEKCTEPYGTLSYVAPEVLLEKPYGKEVDLWTIGIIAFLLLCGYLPFDDEHSEKEIARKTIREPVIYEPKEWSCLSKEALQFVSGLLKKNPKERMTIQQVLEHDWIKKYNKAAVKRRSLKGEGGLFNLYVTD